MVSTPASGEIFSIIPISYGDVDDDGTILAYDAALTLQYSVGIDPLLQLIPYLGKIGVSALPMWMGRVQLLPMMQV